MKSYDMKKRKTDRPSQLKIPGISSKPEQVCDAKQDCLEIENVSLCLERDVQCIRRYVVESLRYSYILFFLL